MCAVYLERLFLTTWPVVFQANRLPFFCPQNRQVSDPQHLNLWILRSI